MELTDVSVTLMKLKPGIVCVCTRTHLPVCRGIPVLCGTLVEIEDNFMSCFSPRPNSGYQAILLPLVLPAETFLPLVSPPPFFVCGCVHVCACEVQKSTLVVITQILSLIFWVGSLIGVMLSHLSPPTSARIIITTLSLIFLPRFWGLNWNPQEYMYIRRQCFSNKPWCFWIYTFHKSLTCTFSSRASPAPHFLCFYYIF